VEGPNTARDYRHEEEEQQVTSREPVLDAVNKNMFRLEYVIGKGGFGKVWKVEMKKTGKIYAMKEMFKTKIIDKKSINSVMNERQLLSRLKHPFLVNMSYAFQDR
jgi:serine/threonine protein kinase